MGKRVAFILVIILVAGVIVLGYFLRQSRQSLFTDPFKAIGSDACLIIETTDIQSLLNSVTTGKGIFSEIEKIKEFSRFNSKLKYLADQINKPGYKRLIQEGTALISFHPADNGKLEPLLSKAIPAEITLRQVREALLSSSATGITEHKVDGKRMLAIPYSLDNDRDTAFITTNSGLLICSTSRELIKRAFDQTTPGTDIRNVPGFSRILLSSGKKEDKLFIIFSNLAKAIRPVFKSGDLSLTDKIAKLGGSAGGDIFINDNGVSLSGYTESTDPSEILYGYKSVRPAEFQTSKVLPAETALFESIAYSSETPVRNSPSNVPDIIKNLAARMKPYLGEEITKAYIALKNNPFSENTLVIYQLKNRVQCENIFLETMRGLASVNYFSPDEQTKIPVYFVGTTGLISAVRPDFAPGFLDTFYTFHDNYMITGTSYITISRFLYDNLLNKTLANDMMYRDFEKTLPSRAGYLFYCVPSQITDYLSSYLDKDVVSGLIANKNSINKIQSVGFQLAPINGMLYNSLSVRYKDEIVEESPTEWETLLDTTAGIKPFFFTNHNTGAKEIFVQDIKNNAYLINAAGRVLWKVPLRERIISPVFMVDYYGNGKYQLLF